MLLESCLGLTLCIRNRDTLKILLCDLSEGKCRFDCWWSHFSEFVKGRLGFPGRSGDRPFRECRGYVTFSKGQGIFINIFVLLSLHVDTLQCLHRQPGSLLTNRVSCRLVADKGDLIFRKCKLSCLFLAKEIIQTSIQITSNLFHRLFDRVNSFHLFTTFFIKRRKGRGKFSSLEGEIFLIGVIIGLRLYVNTSQRRLLIDMKCRLSQFIKRVYLKD